MEFSVSKAINNLKPSISRRSYPHLTTTPALSSVLPGIGHSIKQTKYIVSLPGYHDVNHLTKKVEVEEPEQNVQNGGGVHDEPRSSPSNAEEILKYSRTHPKLIQTSSITFDSDSQNNSKSRKKKIDGGGGQGEMAKKPKLNPDTNNKKVLVHKFSFF